MKLDINMAKVRLSESKLYSIIQEAVAEALNELDPRTYASAAAKAKSKGDNRYGKFRNAAVSSWNDKYGVDSYKDGKESKQWMDNDYTVNTNTFNHDKKRNYYDMWDGDMENVVYNPNRDTRISWKERYDGGERSFPEKDKYGEVVYHDYANRNPMNQGEKIASQMAKGNGKYIKGKGWE